MLGEGAGARESPHTGQPFSDPHSAFMLQPLWLRANTLSFSELDGGEAPTDFRWRLASKVALSQCVRLPLSWTLLFRSSLWGSALDFPSPSRGSLGSKQKVYMPPSPQESYSLDLCFPPRLKSGVRASLLGYSWVSYRVYNSSWVIECSWVSGSLLWQELAEGL